MFSEADFERDHSDIDVPDEESYYVEEEVTDDEAMEAQRQSQRNHDPDATGSDDSVGFYMPSIIQKSGATPEKPKKQLQKITKKVMKKKKKPESTKKPPR